MGFNSGFKGLNAELNPICHLLVLLGAHHILHISRIRVKDDEMKAHGGVEIKCQAFLTSILGAGQ